ncbi:Rieske (2Fe-2S) protein [Streptomyces sp. TG1A-8]|uniref:Rieske (2Fe-2S) protein n=1 Tax=Streptomyces sp. TG1A-8 TaxID=3051385 RepID=UPI00265C6D73|nr:Rieske (2Fe-2S) protein [Streptomyces sp. TG1A-8]MDO0928742.1 Rieske (2Fe-2S) protein [Streptomyces sp. TG1A-8]
MTSTSLDSAAGPARRIVIAAAGAAGLTVALASCGSEDDSTENTSADSAGTVLGKTSEIPEGGGRIYKEQGVVVTQPTAGTYRAFSSKCTHQGCAVTTVENGAIACPCHHSRFSVADGSVQAGPATRPLPAERITVSGDEIRLA